MRKLALLLVLVVMSMNAQEKVSLNVSVDGRLALLGDDKGNEPLTLNTLIRFELQGNQQDYGFMFIAPEYEYADLDGGEYHRYSANVGYTFNRYAIERLEIGISMGFGYIVRDSRTYLSIGGQVDFGYRLTDRIRTVFNMQFVDRTDIKGRPLRGSLFGGVKYYLN